MNNNEEEVKRNDHSLKGLRPGEVSLIFTSLANPSLTYSLDIQILREPITSLTTSLTSETSIIKGMTSKLQVKANTLDFTMDDIDFVSSDPDILSIDNKGYIYSHEVGKASVSVKAKNYDITSTPIEIQVLEGPFTPVSLLTYEVDDMDIYVGNIRKFKALPGSTKEQYAVRVTEVIREEE